MKAFYNRRTIRNRIFRAPEEMTAQELAAYTGAHPQTIKAWLLKWDNEGLELARTEAGRWLVNRDDFLAWLYGTGRVRWLGEVAGVRKRAEELGFQPFWEEPEPEPAKNSPKKQLRGGVKLQFGG
jgi:hypothetical protein